MFTKNRIVFWLIYVLKRVVFTELPPQENSFFKPILAEGITISFFFHRAQSAIKVVRRKLAYSVGHSACLAKYAAGMVRYICLLIGSAQPSPVFAFELFSRRLFQWLPENIFFWSKNNIDTTYTSSLRIYILVFSAIELFALGKP